MSRRACYGKHLHTEPGAQHEEVPVLQKHGTLPETLNDADCDLTVQEPVVDVLARWGDLQMKGRLSMGIQVVARLNLPYRPREHLSHVTDRIMKRQKGAAEYSAVKDENSLILVLMCLSHWGRSTFRAVKLRNRPARTNA